MGKEGGGRGRERRARGEEERGGRGESGERSRGGKWNGSVDIGGEGEGHREGSVRGGEVGGGRVWDRVRRGWGMERGEVVGVIEVVERGAGIWWWEGGQGGEGGTT